MSSESFPALVCIFFMSACRFVRLLLRLSLLGAVFWTKPAGICCSFCFRAAMKTDCPYIPMSSLLFDHPLLFLTIYKLHFFFKSFSSTDLVGVFAIFCKLGTFSTLILRYVYAADIAASFLSCFFRLSLGSTMLSSTSGSNCFRLRISIINFGVVRLYSHSFWGFTCLISLDGVYVFHFAFFLLSLVF